jgi:hypothetical protein
MLDTLEFRSPIANVEFSNGRKFALLFDQVWQRRFKSLWAYVLGIQKPVTLDFPLTVPGLSSLTVAMAGVALGDFVTVAPVDLALIFADTYYHGYVSAAGFVSVVFVNGSLGNIDPPSGVFNIRVNPQ